MLFVALSGSISVAKVVRSDIFLAERPFIPSCTVPVIAPIIEIGTIYVANVLEVQRV